MVGALWGWVEIFFGKEVEFGAGTAVLDGSVDLKIELLDRALDGGECEGTLLLLEELAPVWFPDFLQYLITYNLYSVIHIFGQ